MPQQQTSVIFSFTIDAALLNIISAAPSNGQVGVPYAHQFVAEGGVAPYTWSVVQGAAELAAVGLSLSNDGLLSGVPTAHGPVNNIEVRVTDSGV